MDKEAHKCTSCGAKLNAEERENPRKDSYNDPICDDCYREQYQFICSCCEEYAETTERHVLLVVFIPDTVSMRSEDEYLKPGVYHIVKNPYYGTDYFDTWILWKAISWLCDIPFGMEGGDWYPCGHLCSQCQERIWEHIGARPLPEIVQV